MQNTILLLVKGLEEIHKLNKEQLELNRVLTAHILSLDRRITTCERWIQATESQSCETVSDYQSEGRHHEDEI